MKTAENNLAAHFTFQSDEWGTPRWLFDSLNREFGFTIDVCATKENAKCDKYFTQEQNGLLRSWEDEVVWMNPPYGRSIGKWMTRAHGAAMNELATVVCLVPSRTDTVWWHDFAMKHEVRFCRGRLKFNDGNEDAPFPSAIVVMRPATFSLNAFK